MTQRNDSAHQNSSRRGQALSDVRRKMGGRLDQVIGDLVAMLEQAATSIEQTLDASGTPPPPFARSASLRLRSGAAYLKNQNSDRLITDGIAAARRHPAWFVTSSAALAGLAAYWLVTPLNSMERDNDRGTKRKG